MHDIVMDFVDKAAAEAFLEAEGWMIEAEDGSKVAADDEVTLDEIGVIQVPTAFDEDGQTTETTPGGKGRYAYNIRLTGERSARFSLARLQKDLEADANAPGNGKRLRREAGRRKLPMRGKEVEKIQPERDQIDAVDGIPVTQRAIDPAIAGVYETGAKTVPVKDDAVRKAAIVQEVSLPKRVFL